MKKILFIFCLLFLPLSSYAFQPLPPDQAFIFSDQIAADGHTLIASWQIAPGYHLYRDRITFNVSPLDIAKLGIITLPTGIPKEDNILGKYQVYQNTLTVKAPFSILKSGSFAVRVGYQGCADSGFCYPPVTKQLALNSNGTVLTTTSASPVENNSAITTPRPVTPHFSLMEQDKITQLLAGPNRILILLGFLGFGFLLAFTPCVLPMIPILSSIIVGQGKSITIPRAFTLSLTYVLAMAVTYAGAGVLAGLAGSYVQAFLQNAWVIAIFSAVFVLLALSLFGFYELRMPHFLHHHVTTLSNKQASGNYVGVAIMGCLATLIVSPCVTAPLIGALSYIGKTGNAVFGGTALFAMGLGMGIPLLIIGTLGGEFLPKAGGWMDVIKAIFGVLMLAIAIMLISRIISPHITMLLWAGLFIITAIYMGALTSRPRRHGGKLWKAISLILLVYGFLLLVGATMSNTDPLQPLAIKQAIQVANAPQAEPFQIITNMDDMQQALSKAKAEGKPVMLDFYADWCLACKEMDNNVFPDPAVQRKLSKYVLLRADVTANDADTTAIEKYFGVIAPPTILFFDANGQEIPNSRIVGEVSIQDLVGHVGQCSAE